MKLNVKIFIAIIIIYASSFAQNKLPDWAKGVVWYQIFPERFTNCINSIKMSVVLTI